MEHIVFTLRTYWDSPQVKALTDTPIAASRNIKYITIESEEAYNNDQQLTYRISCPEYKEKQEEIYLR